MKKAIFLSLLLLLVTFVNAQTTPTDPNPMLKLTPFTGNWSYIKYTKSQGDADYKIKNDGEAVVYYTSDSSTIVVDELSTIGHLFRGIHNYNFEKNYYNNYAIETDGGLNITHYRWDDKLERGVWFDGIYVNPNNSGILNLSSDTMSFSAEWFFENPNKQIFMSKTLKSGEFYYSTMVVYTR